MESFRSCQLKAFRIIGNHPPKRKKYLPRAVRFPPVARPRPIPVERRRFGLGEPNFCVLFRGRVRNVAGMILWALALFIVTCTAVVGYYQGALRAAFSLVGLVAAALLGVPTGLLFKSVLPALGVGNPLYLAFLSPVLGFVLVLTCFKAGALAAHKKVEAYYRYKANDTQRMLFERKLMIEWRLT